MKKIMLLACVMLLLSIPSFAESEIGIEVDGKLIPFEVAPKIVNDRVLVPFRALFEYLSLEVDWNSNLKIATAYNDQMNVSIKIDEMYGSIDGELIRLDAEAIIVDGRTLVPIRFISEAFGSEVKWDAAARKVVVKSGFKPYVYTEALPTVDSFEKLNLIFSYAGKFTNNYYPLLRDWIVPTLPESFDDQGNPVPVAAEPMPSPEAKPEFSETNLQVAGVDEADIVKTDGFTLYQVRQNAVKIVDLQKDKPEVLTTLTVPDGTTINELYLYDGKLVIIGQEQNFGFYSSLSVDMRMIMPYMPPKTKVLFYDVTTPSKPVLLKDFTADGYYVTSRLTGGNLYLIANKNLSYYGMTADQIEPQFSEVLILPTGKKTNDYKITYDKIRYFPDTVETSLMMTIGFKMNELEAAPDINVYVGGGNQVYASKSRLIIALDRYHYAFMPNEVMGSPSFEHSTSLYQFYMIGGKVVFGNKGSVPGRVLNQFSMDSYEGNYRIATTTGDGWNETSSNNLYVLDSNLSIIGKLEGLAPSEQIYSVRFMGDRAYMVTFRQVDPFYVIDLKEPKLPKVLGYLKIPGFSNYLHPVDDQTILGFGRETIDTANGPIQGGIKIGLFDVSDVSNPIEKSKVVLGGPGSWSDALSNHKAIMFAAQGTAFSIPVMLYDESGKFIFQGAYVYDVSASTGIKLRGTSTHLTQAEVDDSVLKWYDTTKNVIRSIWVDDQYYSLSDFGIKVHRFSDMVEVGYMTY